MKKNIIAIIIFIFYTFITVAQIKKRAILPKWVELIDYNIEPKIDVNDVSYGNLTLLYDEQINMNKKEIFTHHVTKITENVGTQRASNINITFDPTYQKLTLHSLKIIRKGKVIDKINFCDFQVIRKETNSESYIYDGSLSAFTNISDVRSGDIVDYSYTIKGFNPIHGNNYSAFFGVESLQPVGKMFIKIISRKPIRVKYFETDFVFKENKKKQNHTYTLSEENIKPHKSEEGTPTWYISSGTINISNYKSWEEVVDWGVKIFNVNSPLSKDLSEKIKEIQANNKTEGKKIEATLNFVQDEVRYLGLESGIGAYKPFPPNKVFKQRFGDCKDKSLLMVTMLKAMSIEAYPVLINSYFKETITKLLPGSENFNHCVVKVLDKSKREFWYDPTISNQGGSYDNTAFPDYRYGLVLEKENKYLEEIFPFETNLVEVTNDFVLDEEGSGATLKISSVYHEGQADYIRSFFKNNSLSSIQLEYESYHSQRFGAIKTTKPPKYIDDLKNNKFTLYEDYRIDSLWKPSINEGQVVAEFYPYTITELLYIPTKFERKTPFSLYYPTSRNHIINVKVPDDWDLSPHNFDIRSPEMYYSMYVHHDKSENLLTIDHTFKTQKDYVNANEFHRFVNNLKKLDNQINYNLITSKKGKLITNEVITPINSLKIYGTLIYLALVGMFIWLGIKLYKYDPIPKIESYYEENKKISGWLIVIGIILCLSFIKIIIDLIEGNPYLSGRWLTYFSSKNLRFDTLLAFILFLETILNALVLVYYPLIIVVFFQKRSSFPKIHSIFLICLFVCSIFDYIVTTNFMNNNYMIKNQTNILLVKFISSLLIVPYLLGSDIVKETFTITLKKKH
ncbi:DUF3857 domain-containing protein [uncultured Tenacibaculum sp.]|uniref:DUF3857 domain-containing protein n=1 Tax=uncultured Tenacibaculum sp. TaxID=174713 RepID=UPI00262861FC|nr:DUF3857 domain-containing protein [uncultured Tenacibaculum sp.]